MVNKINFDQIPVSNKPEKLHSNNQKVDVVALNQTSSESENEGVAVTNHMNDLVKLVTSTEVPIDNNSVVYSIKNRLQNHDYKIDFGNLSEKLLNSGVLSRAKG